MTLFGNKVFADAIRVDLNPMTDILMRKAENAKLGGGPVKVDALIRDGATSPDRWGLPGVSRSKEEDREGLFTRDFGGGRTPLTSLFWTSRLFNY